MPDQIIFGAFASVRIRFAGSLHELAARLSRAIHITGFNIEPSEYPPHKEIGSAEALGWEVWLEADTVDAGWFNLRAETEHAVDEVFHGRMYDLSPWLARFVATMCGLEVTPVTPDSASP